MFDFVTLWPDMDAEDELGRRRGAGCIRRSGAGAKARGTVY